MPPNPETANWSAARAVPPANGQYRGERSDSTIPAHVAERNADPGDVGTYGGSGAADPEGYGHYDPNGHDDPNGHYDPNGHDDPNEHFEQGERHEPSTFGGYDDSDDDRGYDDRDDDRGYDDYFDDDEDDFEDIDTTSSATRNALEWAVVLVGAVLVALVLRASLFQAFWIPSESMETTLLTDDRVLVNKVSYRLHDINRGDVIVFARPDEEPGEIRDLIKRVIALPGETVEARDNVVYINQQRVFEPYLDADIVTDDFGPTVVPEGEVFVMGDNRGDSYDSRWFGTVSEERVVGRAFVLFWPIGRIGSL